MPDTHISREESQGTVIKLHRGERMCLIGMDLDTAQASDDFVGFAIEYREPGSSNWKRVWNRLQFSYDGLTDAQKKRGAPSTKAPIQKFRWLHFPYKAEDGEYRYRVTPMYMQPDQSLVRGHSAESVIDLSDATAPGLVDVGFTRGYASSQAYANRERFPCQEKILPPPGSSDPADLEHDMSSCEKEYEWLGFEGRKNIYGLLDEAIADPQVTVDAMIYEMAEPTILGKLEQLGGRLRALVDDHGSHKEPDSCETKAANSLQTAGAQVKRTHFSRQQHNKVFILCRNGQAFKTLAGSTNFSLRGLYVQSNNTLVFENTNICNLFRRVFERYFEVAGTWGPAGKFRRDPLSQVWHEFTDGGTALVRVAFSPHADPALSLDPVADAIEQATSSVLYAVVFLNQLTGRVRESLEDLMQRSIFSYGISQRRGRLAVYKPDGSRGLVSFAFLSDDAPEPFSSEWSSFAGSNNYSNVLHHKFVVTDFNTENAQVFTGSSNMAKGGEKDNGDHMITFQDPRIVTAYAVEALRSFDHFHFRVNVAAADSTNEVIKLAMPPASGDRAWFYRCYLPGHVKERDRLLFSS